MMEIENWMKQYCGAVRAAFGDRVRYIGLQGSRGRGEAGPDSDIDVVCILDSCSLQDLETYRAAVKDLPDRDKLCGFVSGTAELAAWDRGSCSSSAGTPPTGADTLRTCCRRRSQGTPAGPSIRGPADCITCAATTFSTAEAGRRWEACKAAVFLLQAKLYAEQGLYCRRRSDLEQHPDRAGPEILQLPRP